MSTSLKTLISKLNDTCRQAAERAACRRAFKSTQRYALNFTQGL